MGHILTSELDVVAGHLREAGHEAPALAELAAAPPRELGTEARLTFERALRELGRGAMSTSEAAVVVARRFADLLLAGTITPRAGAKAIARLRWKGGADVDPQLGPFEQLAEQYEAAEQSRARRLVAPRLDRATRGEARKLLNP